MRSLMRRAILPIFAILLICVAFSVFAEAGEGRPGRRSRSGGGSRSVAEPAAVVLLGAGLVSLGFYVKRKRKEK